MKKTTLYIHTLRCIAKLDEKVFREDSMKEIYIFEAGEDVAPDPEER